MTAVFLQRTGICPVHDGLRRGVVRYGVVGYG